jgi:hypothetical protein
MASHEIDFVSNVLHLHPTTSLLHDQNAAASANTEHNQAINHSYPCMLLSAPYGSSGAPPASDQPGDTAGSAPPLLPVLRLPGDPVLVLGGSSSCAPRCNSSPRAPPAGAAASSGADLAPVHKPCCSVGDTAAAALPLVSDEY